MAVRVRLDKSSEHLVYLPFVLGLLAGAIRAINKWADGEPEWSYYRAFVYQTLEKATGPDEKLFGYLPGAKALLTPFVRLEPAGYFVFLILSVASCVGIFILLRKSIQRPHFQSQRLKADFWLSICMAAPTYLAIQNNQIVSFSLFFLLCAFAAARKARHAQAGIFFANACLIKTLPLAASAFLILTGRWRSLFWGLMLLLMLSLGFATWTDGYWASYVHHRNWPEQVTEQNPMEVLEGDVPFSFDVNQSPTAYIMQLSMAFDISVIAYIWQFVFWMSLCFICVLTLVKKNAENGYWVKAAAWLAWIAFAAPFGRYYYLLFCVPAWYLLGWPTNAARRTLRFVFWGAPVVTLTAGGGNPSYAIYATISFFLCFIPLMALDNRIIPFAITRYTSGYLRVPGFVSRYARVLKSINLYAAVVAALLIVSGLIALREYRIRQSEKNIVMIFESLRLDGYSDLTFVIKDIEKAGTKFRPIANAVDDSNEDSIRTLLADEDEDFIVLNYREMPDFLDEFGPDAFDLVFREGVYFLLRERSAMLSQPHSRPPSPSGHERPKTGGR